MQTLDLGAPSPRVHPIVGAALARYLGDAQAAAAAAEAAAATATAPTDTMVAGLIDTPTSEVATSLNAAIAEQALARGSVTSVEYHPTLPAPGQAGRLVFIPTS